MTYKELAEPLKKLLDCVENDEVINIDQYGYGYTNKFCEAMDNARFSYGRYLALMQEERMSSEDYKKQLMAKGFRLVNSSKAVVSEEVA